MNPINPQHTLHDVAEVYFTDGVVLGASVAMRNVGVELPELILGTFEQIKAQLDKPPTLGTATAVFIYRAVGTGNHVSVNPPPTRVNLGAQLSYIFQREHAIGGIGTVIINLATGMVTVYGGRGFPDLHPSNPYMESEFSIEVLLKAQKSGIDPVDAPQKPARKKAARKKAAKKAAKRKARPKKPANVVVT